jgi:ribokinase
MVGKVGRDAFGEQVRRGYEAEGIDTTYLFDDRQPTGVATILVDDNGENCILVAPGANHSLRVADVRRAAPAIRSADVLLCQLEVPLEATAAALHLAHRAGAFTILNPAPAHPLPDELFDVIDILVPNETELGQLTGMPCETPEQMKKAARSLRNKGLGFLLVTLGERGALDVAGTTTLWHKAIAVEAVDTSGAGDAFIGALAVYLGKSVPWHQAVLRAMAVAALSVTKPGTQSSYPTRRQAEAFLRQHGLNTHR